MKRSLGIFAVLALGLILLSCSKSTEPEPPLYVNLTFQDADWVLHLTGSFSNVNPALVNQYVYMEWLGIPEQIYPSVIPSLFINGEFVELHPVIIEYPSTHIGTFSALPNSTVNVVLKDKDTQIVYLNTSLKLVDTVSDFYTTNPYNFDEDYMFYWSLGQNSPFQLFEVINSTPVLYRYIKPSQREYRLSKEISQDLSQNSGYYCIIRQVNFKLKDRIAIYSTSFDTVSTGKDEQDKNYREMKDMHQMFRKVLPVPPRR